MINQRIIAIATWIAALVLLPLAIADFLEGDNTLFLGLIAFGFLVFIFFVLKDNTSTLPLLGAFFIGKLNFLPFDLNAPIIFSATLVAYYFFAYFALQRKGLNLTPYALTVPILIITLIVIYHNRQVGLHALGSSTEGSRPGLVMLLGSMAFFCGISIACPSLVFLKRLPVYCTLLFIVTSVPGALTTFFPDMAPYLYYFTDAINLDVYMDTHGVDTDFVRNGAFAGIGLTVITFILAYYPVHTWWRPHRWWAFFLSLICIGLVLSGGFRSEVAIVGVTILLSIWCYHSWRALIILPIFVLIGAGTNLAIQNRIVDLPLNVQRSLSFLPGSWNSLVTESTASSNDFRKSIQDVYLREELHKSPWFGNGFVFDTNEYTTLLIMARTADTADHYYQSKAFITGKLYHIGWISLYDTIGLVGSLAFIALALAMIRMTARFVFRENDRASPLFPFKVWLFCNITRDLIAYFTVFGDIRTTFINLCAYAIVLIQLRRLELSWSENPVLSPTQQEPVLDSEVLPGSSLPVR